MKEKPLLIFDFNIDIAFKVNWAEFMKMRELIYTMTEIKKARFA